VAGGRQLYGRSATGRSAGYFKGGHRLKVGAGPAKYRVDATMAGDFPAVGSELGRERSQPCCGGFYLQKKTLA